VIVVVVHEHRYERTPDGVVWTRATFGYAFWKRYLDVFDGVRVVARVADVPQPPGVGKPASGAGVEFAALPYFLGPRQYLLKRRAVRRAMHSAVEPGDAVILRIPGTLGSLLAPRLVRERRPFGVEVVGDPYDVFAPGSVKHIARPFFRWWFPRKLRRECAAACAAAYVTERSLQQRYPPAPGGFTTHYSSIELGDDAFVAGPRAVRNGQSSFALVHVGTLEQLYKAPDVLIDAAARCIREGLDLRLTLIGEGQYRPQLQAQAERLDVADRVRLPGRLPPGVGVRTELDRADLFVLASHQEGLPRAMIEAMARGLPCIGSTVGGIPELLPSEDMVAPGDVDALARRIREMLGDPPRLAATSARNLARSREYHSETLQRRRRELYTHVRRATEAWLAKGG
jgi:glycosyltransferase involved in cell wall biosynthesis